MPPPLCTKDPAGFDHAQRQTTEIDVPHAGWSLWCSPKTSLLVMQLLEIFISRSEDKPGTFRPGIKA